MTTPALTSFISLYCFFLHLLEFLILMKYLYVDCMYSLECMLIDYNPIGLTLKIKYLILGADWSLLGNFFNYGVHTV